MNISETVVVSNLNNNNPNSRLEYWIRVLGTSETNGQLFIFIYYIDNKSLFESFSLRCRMNDE